MDVYKLNKCDDFFVWNFSYQAYSKQEDFVPLPPPVHYFMVGIATAASVCFTSA